MFADVLGAVLFGATAIVAGLGLLRPLAGPPAPATLAIARWAAGLTALAAVLAAAFGAANPFLMAALGAAALAVPAVLDRRAAASSAGAALTTILVVATAYQPSIVDIRVAPAYTAGVVVVLGALLAVRETHQTRQLSLVAMVAAVVAAGFGVSEILAPAPAPSGVTALPEVHLAGQHVPVFVTPGRPGRNLVLLGAGGVRVGADPGRLVAAEERPGADGWWAAVDLPPGAGTLWLDSGGERVSVPMDMGRGDAVPASVTGPDGPECAAAALGAALAGRGEPACPADALAPADEASLRGLVGFLAGRGVRAIAVSADDSARSRAAATTVRDAAARAKLTVADDTGADRALVVVSGWAAADATLRTVADRQRAGVTYGFGTYLAPWLLAAPVVKAIAGTVVPLRFDPRDPDPVRYQLALATRFHGLHPTAAGYRGWLGGTSEPGATRLYAASLVGFLPAELAAAHQHGSEGGWLPGGTVVPVTGPIGV